MNASERIRNALVKESMTVRQLFEETGVSEISIRRILGTAIAFGAITATRNPTMRCLRYKMTDMYTNA
ncbi:MAG: hypothetical protein DRR06_18690 [Gammaproteobacteria bacterium]|nr:MAG: hypothetical protein DRR06_18690 [Gammaproteobacteria bacterium]